MIQGSLTEGNSISLRTLNCTTSETIISAFAFLSLLLSLCAYLKTSVWFVYLISSTCFCIDPDLLETFIFISLKALLYVCCVICRVLFDSTFTIAKLIMAQLLNLTICTQLEICLLGIFLTVCHVMLGSTLFFSFYSCLSCNRWVYFNFRWLLNYRIEFHAQTKRNGELIIYSFCCSRGFSCNSQIYCYIIVFVITFLLVLPTLIRRSSKDKHLRIIKSILTSALGLFFFNIVYEIFKFYPQNYFRIWDL